MCSTCGSTPGDGKWRVARLWSCVTPTTVRHDGAEPRLGKVMAGEYQAQVTPPDSSALAEATGVGFEKNPYATQTIVGRQIQTIYHVYSLAALSPEELDQRLDLIDQLRAEAISPVAIETLDHARALLLRTERDFR